MESYILVFAIFLVIILIVILVVISIALVPPLSNLPRYNYSGVVT